MIRVITNKGDSKWFSELSEVAKFFDLTYQFVYHVYKGHVGTKKFKNIYSVSDDVLEPLLNQYHDEIL